MEKDFNRTNAINFQKRQESARKRTCLLSFLFVLGVSAVGVSVWPVWLACVILMAIAGVFLNIGIKWAASFFTTTDKPDWAAIIDAFELFCEYRSNPDAIFYTTIFVAVWICCGTAYKIFKLKRQGACGVAEKLGGTRIDSSATDWSEKRFYNVVEETALAFGVPVPAVYVLRDEDGINACALGGDVGNSAVAATAGAIRLLTRDELQGVVAHEFAHLVNGDAKINMRLIGVLFGLQIFIVVGLAIWDFGKDSGHGLSLTVTLMLMGAVGGLVAGGIRAAILRQREFLADATAARATRNPLGLANALKKIGGLEKGSTLSAPASFETAHLFFGSVFTGAYARFFQTHPDLRKRILALDPTFDGVFVKVDASLEGNVENESRVSREKFPLFRLNSAFFSGFRLKFARRRGK